MVIDFHTHAFPDAIAQKAIDGLVKASGGIYPPCSDGTVDGLKRNMESFGVELGTEGPATEPLETETPFIDWETESVTEPIVEDTLAGELETEETPGDKPERPGLFYEFFGDVEWTGCKRTSPGYTGLGCMGTGCTSAAGGLLLLSLIAAGLVFRKKDE